MEVKLTVEFNNEPGYETGIIYVATAYSRGDVTAAEAKSTFSLAHALQLLSEEIEKL